MPIDPPIPETRLFQNVTMKIYGQGHECDQSTLPFLKYGHLKIWPWKSKVNVMAKVKPSGHIWGLEFNRYVCFSSRGKSPLLAEMWQIPYLTLKIQGQGHDENRTKSNTCNL